MADKHLDRFIPDEGPEDARVLFVGEAPGADEHEKVRPFIGESGMLLVNCIKRNGLNREDVRLANLCHYRPHDNKFENLLGSQALADGVKNLYKYIEEHKEHIHTIVPLGAWPLMMLSGLRPSSKRNKTPSIMHWRGSILSYVNDTSIKVIPTIHPAAVLRERKFYPTFDFDIGRAIADSAYREKRLPVREYVCDPRGLDLEEWVQKLIAADYLGTDIENVKKSTKLLCCGFSPSPSLGVCISAEHHEGQRAIARILAAKNKKIFHFGFHDIRVLRENGYLINDDAAKETDRAYWWDTYIAQHVMNPELPKLLSYLTSTYTREPYYKHEGRESIPGDQKEWSLKTLKRNVLYEYNAKDCCVTTEIYEKQIAEIDANPNFQYTFGLEMGYIEMLDEISSNGMAIDMIRRQTLIDVLLAKWARLQRALDGLSGFETNVRSPKLKNILYDKDKVGLPPRRNRDGGLTTDEDAIVSLITYCKAHLNSLTREDAKRVWTVKLAICKAILEIRGLRQNLSVYLFSKISDDHRVRSIYKVGPETGRYACSKYVDGTGVNAQTIPRDAIDVPEESLIVESSTRAENQRLLDILRKEDIEDDDNDEESEDYAA